MRWLSTREALGGRSDADGQLAAVETAAGADPVRQLGGLALGAGAGAHDFQRVMGAPAVAAGLGMAALGIRHGLLLGVERQNAMLQVKRF